MRELRSLRSAEHLFPIRQLEEYGFHRTITSLAFLSRHERLHTQSVHLPWGSCVVSAELVSATLLLP